MLSSRRFLIGLAPGSTGTGIDAALVQASGVGLDTRFKVVASVIQPHPRELREALTKLGAGQPVIARQITLAHRLLGEAFAVAARQVADQAGCGLQQVLTMGVGGHRLGHEPEGRYPSTLGLGMTALIAERTGVTVVSDFRSRDLAVGGQGCGLTALADHLLLGDLREVRVLLHLGAMAGIVYLPPDHRPRRILGFHAGPCNALLDGLMHRLTGGREAFDSGGKHAVQGRCLEPLLERWLGHPALQRRPPRVISPLAFGPEFVNQALLQVRKLEGGLHDLLCTATHFVARAFGLSLSRHLPERPGRVLVSGGGVHNGFLWKLLEQQAAPGVLERIDAHGVPIHARKATAFAGLAALTLDGVPANLTSATGATGSRLLGSLTPGSPANWANCLNWMNAVVAHPLAA